MMINDPPNTVCEVQAGNLKGSLQGQLFSDSVNKKKIPPLITKAQEACQQGNSAGSCFEYFSILRKAVRDIKSYSSNCRNELVSIPEVQKGFKDGVILMSKMAWGEKPPEPGVARFGWLSDSELGLFCLIKDIYSQSFGEEAWDEFRLSIFRELPGDSGLDRVANSIATEPPKAISKMAEKDIWARSIFSIRCENYR
ncbi:MAG: hypothetical protein ACXVBQ_17280 [Pseudobdellovibrionaceae bacterium]